MATVVTGFNHTLKQQYLTQAGTVAEVLEIINGDSEVNVDESVPAGATDYLITVAVSDTAVQSLAIWASAAALVRTNTTGGTDIFNLVTTHPVLWNRNSAQALPLTAPVTALYVDNATPNPVRVRASFLLAAHV